MYLHSHTGTVGVPRLQIKVDPTSPSHPITTSHFPPLPAGCSARVEVGRVSLEEVIGECVRARSSARLQLIQENLSNTVWEKRGLCVYILITIL